MAEDAYLAYNKIEGTGSLFKVIYYLFHANFVKTNFHMTLITLFRHI